MLQYIDDPNWFTENFTKVTSELIQQMKIEHSLITLRNLASENHPFMFTNITEQGNSLETS